MSFFFSLTAWRRCADRSSPSVGIAEAELLDDVHAHDEQVRLVVRRDHVLLALPRAPVLPFHAVDQAVSPTLSATSSSGSSRPSAISWKAIGDSTEMQCGGIARGEVGHQLHVDRVPGQRLELELQAGRELLRPFVHRVHRNAAVRPRLAPYPHRAGLVDWAQPAVRGAGDRAGATPRGRTGTCAGSPAVSLLGVFFAIVCLLLVVTAWLSCA